MRVLVLCDDYWHPARTPRAGLAPLEQHGFTFDWVEDARTWSPAQMNAYPVVLLTKANHMSAADRTPWVVPAVEQAFQQFVQRGGGLLVVHSGTAGYEETATLRALIGGVFVKHPPQCPVMIEPLSGHTVTAGSTSFTIIDEHYHMAVDDPLAEQVLTTRSEHGAQPGGWLRSEGNGRVCVLTPGHNLEVWLHQSYQVLLRNSLLWCGMVEG